MAETLVGLELWMLPALRVLDGIEAFTNLQALTLSSVRGVTTLDWVRRLPTLRLLDISELKNVAGEVSARGLSDRTVASQYVRGFSGLARRSRAAIDPG